MNIFKFAMEKEKKQEKNYRALALKSRDAGIKKLFTMLADDEGRHFILVQKMSKDIPVKVVESKVLKNAKSIFSKKKIKNDSVDFGKDQIGMYKKAQKNEEWSRDFYLAKAKQEKKAALKGIFLNLAEEEKKHYWLLENIIEFVSRPMTWVENAEFTKMEDY